MSLVFTLFAATASPAPVASPAGPDGASEAPAPIVDPRRTRRTRFVDAAPLDIPGTGARAAGSWAGAVQVGWPWFALRAQVGVARRLALLLEVETALARRWRPAFGV